MNLNIENLDFESLIKEKAKLDNIVIEKAKQQGGASAEELQEIKEQIKGLEKQIKSLQALGIPQVKELKINDLPSVKTDDKHKNFEKLLTLVSCKINTLLVGEAGSGKTSAAGQVAKALNLPFYSLSVGLQTGKHEFFGFKNANGEFVETEFYKAYTQGGVFLIDELDAGHAGVLTAINSALANGSCAFANGMQKKHDDFILIATANTYGHGATAEYVGRNIIDGATLDRFAVLDWNIDETLELKISYNKEFAKQVQEIRSVVKNRGIKHLVTTRAILSGEKLLKAGLNISEVLKLCVYKGLASDSVKMIEEQRTLKK